MFHLKQMEHVKHGETRFLPAKYVKGREKKKWYFCPRITRRDANKRNLIFLFFDQGHRAGKKESPSKKSVAGNFGFGCSVLTSARVHLCQFVPKLCSICFIWNKKWNNAKALASSLAQVS